jgi:hypothetical protein
MNAAAIDGTCQHKHDGIHANDLATQDSQLLR